MQATRRATVEPESIPLLNGLEKLNLLKGWGLSLYIWLAKSRWALQAAEKGLFSNEHCEDHTSGAKALVDSAGLYVGVKTPTYQSRPTARTSFSATCLAPAGRFSWNSLFVNRRWPRSVDFHPCGRKKSQGWGTGHSSSLICITLWLAVLITAPLLSAQEAPPATAVPPPVQVPITIPNPSAQTPEGSPITPQPIAIVPLDIKIPGAAAEVTGGLQVYDGRAFIAANGAITAGSQTTQVNLPHRGTLRVCASTTVKLAADSSVPAGEVPGLMMAMDHGAVEASFATGRDSDILMTPDFRILIGGPGAAEVKVRLGPNGDTCVDNAGVNAPYVLVSSVFDGGAYRVQAGQRVMFQHGNLHEVVDQEKEPCGCPAPTTAGSNDFPLAQSEGLAPALHAAPSPVVQPGHEAQTTAALVYNAADHAPKTAEAAGTATAPPAASPAPATAAEKKPGFFKRVRHFFKRVFGAE
jgi:hypothetical protein